MPNGFFQGYAEAQQAGDELRLKRDALAAETSLKSRALDLTQRAQQAQEQRDAFNRADAQLTASIGVISETISQGLAANQDPEKISKAVRPLIESTKELAMKAGRDPNVIEGQVAAMFARPGSAAAATAAGAAEAAKKVATARGIAAATGEPIDVEPYGNPKDRVQLENALRDDFMKASKDFVVMRDAKTRIDGIQKTGAGDVALVFQYMKLLDPGSTVREGEFATASNSAGVPAAVMAQYNKLLGGGVLADKARDEIKSQANIFYDRAARQHDRLTTQFANIAKRQRLNPDNVIVDFKPGEISSNGRVGDAFGALPPPPPGYQVVR